MSRHDTSPIETLTERENEVLTELFAGLSNQEIANKLHISVKTVKWYNTQIYAKLGATNREEAIGQAQRFGLLGSDALPPDVPHNLPEQVTPFIGREATLRELSDLLTNPDVRLLTLLGPGGMGKTRLSLQTGQRLLHYFTDGVYVINLTSATSMSEIPGAFAQALGIQHSDMSLDDITQYLRKRNMLLILDNFEQLLPDGAGILTRILQNTTGIKFLVTSRERLRLGSETVVTLGGMEFSEDINTAMSHDAVLVFVQNARRLKPQFEPQESDLKHVVHICKLTGGMPLALVLAAAWIEVLSLAEIVEDIQNSMDALAVAMHDMPHRHRSIEAVFDSTWNRLDHQTRTAFMKFAVFRNGCTREAARAITGATTPLLMNLINKSLISRNVETGRYEIHELLRQYAEAKLVESGEMDATEATHAEHFLTMIAQHIDKLKRAESAELIQMIAADWDNIVEALLSSWAWQPENYDAVRDAILAIHVFADISPRERTSIILDVRSRPDSRSKRIIEVQFADWDESSFTHINSMLEQLNEESDRAETALCYEQLAWLLQDGRDDLQGAIAAAQSAYRHYLELGDVYGVGQALMRIGWSSLHDLDSQFDYFLQALDIFTELGNPLKIAHVCTQLANLYAFNGGDVPEGQRYAEMALETALKTGSKRHILMSRILIAWISCVRGDFDTMQRQVALCLPDNDGIQDDLVRLHPYVQLSMMKSLVDEDYEEALQLARYAQENMTHPVGDVYVIAMVVAYLGLEQYAQAESSARNLLEVNHGAGKIMPIIDIALIMGRTGRVERAAELLGFCERYPELIGWAENWSLANEIRAEIEAHLGDAAYQAAYEHGADFDFQTLIHDLQDEI